MIAVDDEKCIGCGLCVDLLPQYFELVDGHVRVRDPEAAPSGDSTLDAALEDCPGGAIFID